MLELVVQEEDFRENLPPPQLQHGTIAQDLFFSVVIIPISTQFTAITSTCTPSSILLLLLKVILILKHLTSMLEERPWLDSLMRAATATGLEFLIQ